MIFINPAAVTIKILGYNRFSWRTLWVISRR